MSMNEHTGSIQGLFNIFHVTNGYKFSFGLKKPKAHKYNGKHFQPTLPPPFQKEIPLIAQHIL
jgi:hypothetical protein